MKVSINSIDGLYIDIPRAGIIGHSFHLENSDILLGSYVDYSMIGLSFKSLYKLKTFSKIIDGIGCCYVYNVDKDIPIWCINTYDEQIDSDNFKETDYFSIDDYNYIQSNLTNTYFSNSFCDIITKRI